MLQGTTVKATRESPMAQSPAGDLMQAINELQRTVYTVADETNRLSEGLSPVLRVLPAAPEAKLTGVTGYSTPLASTIQNLNEQFESAMHLLHDLNARLSI